MENQLKPITEREEFEVALGSYFPNGSSRNPYVDYSLTDMEKAFSDGAKAAQSILQKQYEGKMEEFAEWLDKKGYLRTLSTGKEILQLFRERNNNGKDSQV